MFVEYNGVALEVEHFEQFTQRAIYNSDGSQKLYDHYVIDVKCVFNPYATYSTAGATAAVSMVALRTLLLTPQRPLYIRIPINGTGGYTTLLQSPVTGPSDTPYLVDANMGPKPMHLDIIEIPGTKTMVVRFGIETWVNDCTSIRPLISHTWQMSHSLSEDYYTTRTIRGEAIFRADALYRPPSLGERVQPDDYRGVLVHRVPLNFKRDHVDVAVSADGTTLRYTIVDVEQSVTIKPAYRAITRIKGTYTEWTGVGEAGIRGVMNAAGTGNPGTFAMAVVDWATGTLPPVLRRLNVRVWGNRSSTRMDLVFAIGKAIASFKMGELSANGATSFSNPGFFSQVTRQFFIESSLIVDIEGKYAEASMTYRASGIAHTILKLLGTSPQVATAMPEDIGDVASVDGSYGPDGPPFDRQSRGTYVAHLVAQDLMSGCAWPDDPTDTAVNNNHGDWNSFDTVDS